MKNVFHNIQISTVQVYVVESKTNIILAVLEDHSLWKMIERYMKRELDDVACRTLYDVTGFTE